MTLSERIRQGCEAAPWVIEEVQRLETNVEQLRRESAEAFVDFMIAKWPRLAARSAAYRDTLLEFRAAIAAAEENPR